MQWRVWKLKEKFTDMMKKLVNIEVKNLWDSFKDDVLDASEKLCGKIKQRRERKST